MECKPKADFKQVFFEKYWQHGPGGFLKNKNHVRGCPPAHGFCLGL
jgi:hypothetical protein